MSDKKIAYCMVGCIGGLQGKNHQKLPGSEIVLEHSSKSFFNNVYKDNIDVFIHSWDTHLHESYCKIYNPKKIKIEEQIVFNIPKHINNTPRAQAHFSRWYSTNEVYKLTDEYEKENNIKYDLIVLTRLDLYWLQKVNLSELNSNLINLPTSMNPAGRCGSKDSIELMETFIASNKKNIELISTLYNNISDYMLPNRCGNYNGISSHFLLPYHLKELGLRNKVEFPYIYHSSLVKSLNDSHLIITREIYENHILKNNL